MGIIAERLAQPDAVRGALLDGCTRTLAQAEALDQMLAPEGVSLALNIDVPTSLVAERLSARRVCANCGTIYKVGDGPADSGVCSVCGGPVRQRDDDTPEAITQRLDAYEKDTAPLLTYYGHRGLLATVDGNQDVDQVGKEIDAVLTERHLL
jgi:adenylate kinase